MQRYSVINRFWLYRLWLHGRGLQGRGLQGRGLQGRGYFKRFTSRSAKNQQALQTCSERKVTVRDSLDGDSRSVRAMTALFRTTAFKLPAFIAIFTFKFAPFPAHQFLTQHKLQTLALRRSRIAFAILTERQQAPITQHPSPRCRAHFVLGKLQPCVRVKAFT